jgi:hypothetical protein
MIDAPVLTAPYLDVEQFFDEVVRRAGGYRVDSLIPANPSFENADYYFETDGVFGELKILQFDRDEDERLKARLFKVYREFARAGKVPPISRTQRFIESRLLPVEAQRELLKPLKRRLQGPVRKAAHQLLETKRVFNKERDAGLLILVNEGSALYRPSAIFYFLCHLIRGKFCTGIDHIVYCSVNVSATVPGIDGQGHVWFTANVNSRKTIETEFLKLLECCWMNVLEGKLNIKMPRLKLDSDYTAVDGVVFNKIDPRKGSQRRF